MVFLLFLGALAVLKVFPEVKSHCTNCQSLVRLFPVFSALRLWTRFSPRVLSSPPSQVSWQSLSPELGRAASAP
jgi:hypothetical protein